MRFTKEFPYLFKLKWRRWADYNSVHSTHELADLGESRGTDAMSKDGGGGNVRFDSWGTAPQPLKPAPTVDKVGAVLFVLLPLPFIALVISAFALNNTPLSDRGRAFMQVMQFGPTIYPLVFACVAGTSLRTMALWKVERGTTVATLEKLLGSHTLVNAIGRAIALRSLDFLTLALLILWALSPLGGQGSLRLLYQDNSTAIEEGFGVSYTKVDLSVPHIRDNTTDVWADVVPLFSIDHILSASLTVSDTLKNATLDPWGRPKIPLLKSFRTEEHDGSNLEWIPLNQDPDTHYSSLVGVGVGFQNSSDGPGRTVNFSLPYEYLNAQCNFDSTVPKNQTLSRLKSYGTLYPPPSNVSDNTLLISPRNTRTENVKAWSGFFLKAVSYPDDKNPPVDKSMAHLIFGLLGTGGIQLFQCSLQAFRVDVGLSCQFGICIATAIKKSTSDDSQICHVSEASGCLSDMAQYYSLPLRRFLEFFPTSVSGFTNDFSPIYEYMYGYPPHPGRNPVQMDLGRNWSQIGDDVISLRLTTLLNTFWYSWLWNDEVYSTTSLADRDRYANTTGILIDTQPVYKVNKPWAMALFFSAGILFVVGVFNLTILFRTTVPDPFEFASSLLRTNPFADVPREGSTLNGEDLARLLAETRVQMTDVHPNEDVGKIAFRTIHSGEYHGKALRKNRLYA